jgi:TATA-binding protein-associated factor Taf7
MLVKLPAIVNQYKTIETLSVPRVSDVKQKMIKLMKIEYIHQAKIHETFNEQELNEIIQMFSTSECDHLMPIKEEEIANNLHSNFLSFINQNNMVVCAPVRKVW